ncbi:2597_t:CDS:1, partial [Cetraspora pellucida]
KKLQAAENDLLDEIKEITKGGKIVYYEDEVNRLKKKCEEYEK